MKEERGRAARRWERPAQQWCRCDARAPRPQKETGKNEAEAQTRAPPNASPRRLPAGAGMPSPKIGGGRKNISLRKRSRREDRRLARLRRKAGRACRKTRSIREEDRAAPGVAGAPIAFATNRAGQKR